MGVHIRRLFAEFGHVAQDQPGRACQRSQQLQCGAHGTGIGVVGIVDDPTAARPGFELQPACDSAEIGQAQRDLFE